MEKNNINHLKRNNSIIIKDMRLSNQLLMNKKELKKLSKSQLIEKLLKLEGLVKKKPVSAPRNFIIPPPPQFRDKRPIPMPRTKKSVKSMVADYEKNIILPPLEFRDDYKPTPAPRTKKVKTEKPVPLPRTKIEQTDEALKGFTKCYGISINVMYWQSAVSFKHAH